MSYFNRKIDHALLQWSNDKCKNHTYNIRYFAQKL